MKTESSPLGLWDEQKEEAKIKKILICVAAASAGDLFVVVFFTGEGRDGGCANVPQAFFGGPSATLRSRRCILLPLLRALCRRARLLRFSIFFSALYFLLPCAFAFLFFAAPHTNARGVGACAILQPCGFVEMQLGPQKRTFARPPALGGAPVPATEFNAILRIQKIRQTLCGVVASRGASSERASTPQQEVRGQSPEAQAPAPPVSAAGRFLLSSQRRVEELMRENHRLELLCVSQEETVRELREVLASGRGQQAEGVADASAKRERSQRRNTPSLSRRSQAAPRASECVGAADAAGAPQSSPVPGGLVEAVQQLVDAAAWVFPRLLSDAGASGDGAEKGLETACAVLGFVADHLAEWDRLASESAEVRAAHALLSQTLLNLEAESVEWRATILAVVQKLQATQAEQRRCLQEKDSRIDALGARADALAADVAGAVEERDRCTHRCEDLERSIRLRVEEQASERGEAEQLRRECELLRGELDSLRASAPKDAVAAAGVAAFDAGEQRTWTQVDVEDFQTTIACLTNERDALQSRFDALTHTLAEVNGRVLSLEEEKRELSERLRTLQEDAEQRVQEIAQLKRAAAAAAAASSHETPAAARAHCPAEAHRRWFLQPVECCRFDGAELLTPVVDVSPVLCALGADVSAFADSNEHVRSPGLFFHMGSAIAQDLGLFRDLPSTSLDAWKRFLLQLQTGFRDALFYTADHAAACAQFFYALLLRSGMVPHMGRAELLAAVTAALCMQYGHPGVSGCLLSAAQDPAAAGVHSCILLQRRRLQDLGDLLAQDPFHFLDDAPATHSLLDEVRDLLLPEECDGQCSGVMRACLGLLSAGPLQLESRAMRCRFVQLLLRLSQYAFCMRAFDVHERCAEKWFSLMQRQSQVAAELGIYGFDVPHTTPTAAEAQLLLIEFTVLPLCRIAAQAFPSLQACEEALRANHATWSLRAAQHPTDGVAFELLEASLRPTSASPDVEGAARDAAAASGTDPRALDDARVSAAVRVASGSLLVNTSCFLASQKEMLAAYEDNATLRRLLEALLAPVETLPAPQDVAA
ncbi:3',5'-cyclic-nucleotide phosphodiesterase [Trypanosoma conorhini]|uniref:3',5'-cyclic-nucleotide phosphodiesterase n=1 Tax=Trypanosoma conorhini TaxID=83891 RepID=A0A422PNN4_9TRYP|nr:3',5'-cyclic-nucleotide phosphodiesterase [Trypanosoma conorhini]RNF19346.1 3',5'-cyclic-nucleotide phosphodiesterase [Trypanosoma conorhini]